jgi:hypothetical protein
LRRRLTIFLHAWSLDHGPFETTQFRALNIAVLTISDTRTSTPTPPAALVDRLKGAGHVLVDRGLVIDDIYQIRARSSCGSPIPTCKWC